MKNILSEGLACIVFVVLIGINILPAMSIAVNKTYNSSDFGKGFDGYMVFTNNPILSGNNSPGLPNITGPTNGVIGVEYTYVLNAVDPDGDDVRFHVYWGDGGSEITPYTTSGTDLNVSYTWYAANNFTMRVQAQDTGGLLGPEARLNITIPRNKALNFMLSGFLHQHPNWFLTIRYLLGL